MYLCYYCCCHLIYLRMFLPDFIVLIEIAATFVKRGCFFYQWLASKEEKLLCIYILCKYTTVFYNTQGFYNIVCQCLIV